MVGGKIDSKKQNETWLQMKHQAAVLFECIHTFIYIYISKGVHLHAFCNQSATTNHL